MAKKGRRIKMRGLIQLLRLHFEKQLSQRDIGRLINISASVVNKYIKLFIASGLSWPLESQYENEEILFRRLNTIKQAPDVTATVGRV